MLPCDAVMDKGWDQKGQTPFQREQERKKGCPTELLRNRRAMQGKEVSQEKRVPALWLPGQEGKQKPLPKGKAG